MATQIPRETAPDALDVAAAIIEFAPSVDQMKLQKLLYYAQGWHLAWYGQRLFDEDVEAWRWGPCVRGVYQVYKTFGKKIIPGVIEGSAARLTPRQREAVHAVANAYGRLRGVELANMTHKERPWKWTWFSRAQNARGSQVIPVRLMQDYFRQKSEFGGVRTKPIDLEESLLDRIAKGDGSALAAAFESEPGVKVASIRSK